MAAAAKKTNWFAIWTSVIVAVIVIAVGAFAILGNNKANPTYDLTASKIDTTTGAVSVGDGKTEIATYVDFICPACNSFESQYSNQLLKLASEGQIKLTYHPVNMLDSSSMGTKYSSRAANAFYCVADAAPNKVVEFVAAMYKNQPGEGTEGLKDDKIVQIAKDVGAGDISSCQSDMKYQDLVDGNTKAMPSTGKDEATGQDKYSTPTVTVDGALLPLNTIYGDPNYFTSQFGKK